MREIRITQSNLEDVVRTHQRANCLQDLVSRDEIGKNESLLLSIRDCVVIDGDEVFKVWIQQIPRERSIHPHRLETVLELN